MSAALSRVEPLRIETDGSSAVQLAGAMTFANAARALPDGLRCFERCDSRHITIDCSGVVAADSAGLAVMVEWLAWGRRHDRQIELRSVPRSLIEIARISELEELLDPQSR